MRPFCIPKDLADGQKYGALRVVNPFSDPAGEERREVGGSSGADAKRDPRFARDDGLKNGRRPSSLTSGGDTAKPDPQAFERGRSPESRST